MRGRHSPAAQGGMTITYFQPALPIFLSLACTAIAATQASAASVNTFTRVEVSYGGGVSTLPIDQTTPSADVLESLFPIGRRDLVSEQP